jgi:hypothetical protein
MIATSIAIVAIAAAIRAFMNFSPDQNMEEMENNTFMPKALEFQWMSVGQIE